VTQTKNYQDYQREIESENQSELVLFYHKGESLVNRFLGSGCEGTIWAQSKG